MTEDGERRESAAEQAELDVDAYRYRLMQAEQKLREAGYVEGPDGWVKPEELENT